MIAPISPSAKAADITDINYLTAPLSTDEINPLGLRDISLIPPFDVKEPLPEWGELSPAELIKALKQIQPSPISRYHRPLMRQILVDRITGLPESLTLNEATEIWKARLDALSRLGLFHDLLRLYHALIKTGAAIPTSIAERAISTFALTGQKDGACMEIGIIARHFTEINSAEAMRWKALNTACQTILSPKEQTEEGQIDLTVSEESNSALKTALTMLFRSKHGNIEGPSDSPPYFYAALSYQPYIDLPQRAQYALKAVQSGVADTAYLEQLIRMHPPLPKNSDLSGRFSENSFITLYRHTLAAERPAEQAAVLRAVSKVIARYKIDNEALHTLWLTPFETLLPKIEKYPELAAPAYQLFRRFHYDLTAERIIEVIEPADRQHPVFLITEHLEMESVEPQQWTDLFEKLNDLYPNHNKARASALSAIASHMNYTLPPAYKKMARKLQDNPQYKKQQEQFEAAITQNSFQKNPLLTLIYALNHANMKKDGDENIFNHLILLDFMKNKQLFSIFDKKVLEIILQTVL
mgnify:CR=1 FL=1